MTKLILVPGLLCTKRLFEKQISALKHDYEIEVANTLGVNTIHEMAQEIISKQNSNFVICGLSMGGYVAQMVAHLAPEKVIGMGLFSTSGRADTPEKKQQREALIELSKLGKFKGVTPRLLPSLLSAEALKNEALVQDVMDMAAQVGQTNFTLQQEAIIGRPDFRPFASTAKMPVEILVGALDQLTPPALAEELHSLFQDSHLTVLPGIGHLSSMEAPDDVTNTIKKLISRL